MLAVWRVLTAAVFHMGILHLAFNMLAFVPIGQSLERLVGTVQVRHSPCLDDSPLSVPPERSRATAARAQHAAVARAEQPLAAHLL